MRVVLLELNGTRAGRGEDVGQFKLTEAGKIGIGDRDAAGGVGRWLSRACAVVCWFWAQSGVPERANGRARKRRSSQGQSQSRGRGRGKALGIGLRPLRPDWAARLGRSML